MSKKFKHLNLSPHWQQYFSKYPQGYTIIENLIDWVSQVDKMVDSYNELTDHVDNFKDAVNNTTDGFREQLDLFLGQFDDNLSQTVVEILQEWQDTGFLDVVIDSALDTKYHEMDERLTSQFAQTKGDMYKADTYQSLNGIGYKAIYNTQGTVFVVTKNPNGKGYLRFRLKDDNFTTSQSVGSPAELIRVFEVRTAVDCFVMSNNVTDTSGAEWIDGSTNYVIGGVVQPIKTKRTNARSIDSWIEYTVDVPNGMTGLTALIYGTRSSPTNATISVDGEDVITNLDVSDPDGTWKEIYIPINEPGNHVVRFTTLTDSYFTIGGFKLPLDEYIVGFSYDEVLAFHTSANPYVYNGGAMDYALYDSDLDLWCGSYHGGEVRNRLQYLLDGEEIPLNENDVHIGKTFEVEQDTRIVDKIDAYSVQSFKQDGTIEHSVVFNGDINLTKLFTSMSTTSDAFTEVMYPERLSLNADGNYYLPNGINYIVQKNPITNQKAITILNNNMYPADRRPEPYVKMVSGRYAKVYNDNIDSTEPVNFTGGNFRTVHIFE